MFQRLWIVGAGGHGRVVAEIAKSLHIYNELFFIDDFQYQQTIIDISCVARFNEISTVFSENDHLIVALGNNQKRMEFLSSARSCGYILPSLIHPSAIISPSSKIADGCVVCAQAVIQSYVCINTGCIVNTSSIIEHDVTLQTGVHISPNACLTGGVSIGNNSWVGASATIINQSKVGDNCILAAGSVLTQNMPDNSLFAGIPAIFKKNSNNH